MAGNQAEERVERSMVFQAWRTVAFLHWRVDTQVLARHLPHGLVPGTLDGSGWLGLTPFRVPRFSVLDLPAVPLVSSFNETNLRTYVRRPDGRDGLWFFSRDVDSVVNVGGGLPYFLSAMSVLTDVWVRYRCRRTGRSPRTAIRNLWDGEHPRGLRVEPSGGPISSASCGGWVGTEPSASSERPTGSAHVGSSVRQRRLAGSAFRPFATPCTKFRRPPFGGRITATRTGG
jgi:hypothetical protein